METSTLTSRLRRLVGVGVRPAIVRPEGKTDAVVRSVEHVTEVLGGMLRELEGGCCVVVDRWHTPEMFHGAFRIGQCAEHTRRAIDHLPVVGGTTPLNTSRWGHAGTSILFFDLETTGLAGGAGTYAFLVGCGAFVEGAFHTRQFFLTGYGAERSLLAAVAEGMAGADVLVSFNGRTFDAPLLETRYLFHRVAVPFGGLPHIDMLPAARRLWSRAEGCSLRVLEALAGITRHEDIRGAEIPARYIHYVRTGDARLLVPVFEHNRVDLLSLAVLTSIAMGLVEQGAAATNGADQCLGLGRLYERARLHEQASTCYAQAASGHAAGSLDVRIEALRRLARRLRGARRYEDAAEAWQRILTLGAKEQALAREAAHALAIHHEHRSKDLHAARTFAVQAAGEATSQAHHAAARHRLARLDRKLGQENSTRARALFDA